MIKFNLHVYFLLNVVVCWCILHIMILNVKDVDIDELMLQLVLENVLEKGRYNEMKRGNKGLQEIR